MFKIDNKDIRRFEADLDRFAHRALPFATKATLNSAAFTAQRKAKVGIKKGMSLRNAFSLRSIQVEQTHTLRISQQASVVGSTADYMEDQEFGVIKGKKGKVGVAIPTSYAAGLGENAQPRTRLPRKANKIQNIQLQRRRKKGGGAKQRNIVAIKQAAASGRKFVFLDLKKSKGIFKVTGSAKKPLIKMIYDMSRASVVVPRNPWLEPAFKATQRDIPNIYLQALHFQRKRQGLFKP